ncbi:hypothetical protein FRB99_006611 [Tulasnella sp. 403]|nr:hypothetical protein FRB99_006611 [Tulasnella sp. 403]
MAQAVNIKSDGSTHVPPPSSSTGRASGLVPSPSIASENDDHRKALRRWFIGPMQEKVAIYEVKKAKETWRDRANRFSPMRRRPDTSLVRDDTDTSSDSDSDGCNSEDNASLYNYFIESGGQKEDWDADALRRMKKELKRKWKESAWYNVWASNRHEKTRSTANGKWVGTSFLVGDVLGCQTPAQTGSNISPPATHEEGQSISRQLSMASRHDTLPDRHTDSPAELTDNDAPPFRFVTSSTSLLHTAAFHTRPEISERPVSTAGGDLFPASPLARTSTAFTARSDGHEPSATAGLRSALKSTSDRKGKRKSVNFGTFLGVESRNADGEDTVASPSEVLARTGTDIQGSSAEVTEGIANLQRGDVPSRSRQGITPRDIVMKDRMLVKISYNRSDGLPSPYDEVEAKRHPDTVEEDWAEFMVCWRGNHLELYEDWSLPGKEWFTHKKHLAFIVPLRKPKSHISLYSFVDFSFCVTCPPTPTETIKSASLISPSSKRSMLYKAPSGTDIFVFKCKDRSRAHDWMWHIWQQLGGEVPRFLEISCPDLSSRVRVDIPEDDPSDGEGFRVMTRKYILNTCRKALQDLEGWESHYADELKRGGRLELCWRQAANLEWVRLDEDIDGNTRDWSVIYMLGFNQSKKPSHLELRLVKHASTDILLQDGTRLSQPPPVEGYIYRIKPKKQTKTLVYLSTHDGNLFTTNPAHAHPPEPPAPPFTAKAAGDLNRQERQDIRRQAELRRGASQILQSDGYIDMRNIIIVRRATDNAPPKMVPVETRVGNIPDVNDGHVEVDHPIFDDEHATASDADDRGGEEVFLQPTTDKKKLRLRRSFELVLGSGHVIRFEAHSCTIALEWISKLRSLTSYWTRKHRVDARQEMDLTRAVAGRPRWGSPEIVPDAAGDHPYLGEFWNWCILEGCRPITKAGRLFVKRGPHKQFKHMYHVLTHGHMVLFHLTSKKSSYNHRSRSVNLIDLYVYSGQLAVATLPVGYDGDPPTEITPKIYQDGLEAHDSDEDVTFIIWYRPHPAHIAPVSQAESPGKAITMNATIPPLSGKHKMLICKARKLRSYDLGLSTLPRCLGNIVIDQDTRRETVVKTMLTREENYVAHDEARRGIKSNETFLGVIEIPQLASLVAQSTSAIVLRDVKSSVTVRAPGTPNDVD